MSRKSLCIIILVLCSLALVFTGCPKKTVMKEEPSVTNADEAAAAAAAAAERERAAKREAEERALREKELKANKGS